MTGVAVAVCLIVGFMFGMIVMACACMASHQEQCQQPVMDCGHEWHAMRWYGNRPYCSECAEQCHHAGEWELNEDNELVCKQCGEVLFC